MGVDLTGKIILVRYGANFGGRFPGLMQDTCLNMSLEVVQRGEN